MTDRAVYLRDCVSGRVGAPRSADRWIARWRWTRRARASRTASIRDLAELARTLDRLAVVDPTDLAALGELLARDGNLDATRARTILAAVTGWARKGPHA
jgi:hypothetical protein